MPEILKQESIEKYFKLVNYLSGQLSKAIQEEEWGGGGQAEGADHKMVSFYQTTPEWVKVHRHGWTKL